MPELTIEWLDDGKLFCFALPDHSSFPYPKQRRPAMCSFHKEYLIQPNIDLEVAPHCVHDVLLRLTGDCHRQL